MALAVLLLALPAEAAAAEQPITLEGRVTDARDGSPVAKAEVIVRTSSATTGTDGGFSLTKLVPSAPISFRAHRQLLPNGKDADPRKERYEYFDQTVPTTYALVWVNAEVEIVSENQVRRVPAFGWKVVDLGSPSKVEIQVAMKDPEGEFCRGCHQENGYLSKVTVKAEKPWPVPVTEQLFTGHRFRDLHPTGFDHGKLAQTRPDRFVVSPAGVDLLDGRKATCFTCHTPHRPTQYRGFAKGEYEVKGEFCRRCHR